MVKMIILLKKQAHSPEYYGLFNDFLMKLEALPNILRKSVNDVFNAPQGEIPYTHVIEIFFEDRATLEASLLSPEGIDAGQHLLQFAPGQTEILYANVLEESYE